MDPDRPEIFKDDISPTLWKKYQKTKEFKAGRIHSISSVHPLVRNAESMGLTKVIRTFIGELVHTASLREMQQVKTSSQWIKEWQEMHSRLFTGVLRSHGELRKHGHDVRFGSPGDEELHGIPKGGGPTLTDLHVFAKDISERLKYVKPEVLNLVCEFLAVTHYQFIRIHPFGDGNGRIARALTDQLALGLGYPPVIAGFPRSDAEKKEKYHKAITACIGDPACTSLKAWIKEQISNKIERLA